MAVTAASARNLKTKLLFSSVLSLVFTRVMWVLAMALSVHLSVSVTSRCAIDRGGCIDLVLAQGLLSARCTLVF